MKIKDIRSKISDRTWIVLILIALFFETIWLLSELQIIDLPFKSSSQKTIGSIEAGKILKASENLKRRSGNSLIWEPAKLDETLYYKDSLLTLSGSTATLYLKDQTELQMSENTLVTLEQPEESSNAEIRLRFAKGDVKARNPFNKAAIQSKDWVVNLEKGAEVAMRKGESEIEFEVLAGKAVLNTDAGAQELSESKIIKLGDDKKIETIDKSIELQWKKPQPERVYTFNSSAKVPLEWRGQAEKLNIGKTGQPEAVEEKVINSGESVTDIELPIGSFQVRLKDEKGVSNAKEIEVFPAPKIILKKPLPRDRIQIGMPQEFVWAADTNELKSYKLKLSDGRDFDVAENFKSLQFDQEQDIVWRIEAVDRDGFKIPSFYESKVYLRKDALAAPKLKQPKLLNDSEDAQEEKNNDPPEKQKRKLPNKKSNSSGSIFFQKFNLESWVRVPFLQFLFFQPAQAQVLRNQQVVFEWEPVEGANQYIIEISSDPEFKTPEVIETLSKTSYSWRKYDPKKKYWWRVASGHSGGRMGLFSEPEELKVIIEKPKPKNKPVVKSDEKNEEQKISATSVSTDSSQAASVDNSKSQPGLADDADKHQHGIYSKDSALKIAYAPGFKRAEIAGEQSAKVELNGAVPVAVEVQYLGESANNRRFFVDLYFSNQKWKPENTSSSTQNELNFNEIFAKIKVSLNESRWQYGFALRDSVTAYRTLNGVNVRQINLIGPNFTYQFTEFLRADTGYLIAADFSEISASLQYSNYIYENNKSLFWGADLSTVIQNGPYGSGQQSQIKFLLGFNLFE